MKKEGKKRGKEKKKKNQWRVFLETETLAFLGGERFFRLKLKSPTVGNKRLEIRPRVKLIFVFL